MPNHPRAKPLTRYSLACSSGGLSLELPDAQCMLQYVLAEG